MMLHLVTPSEQHLAGVLCGTLVLLMGGVLWWLLHRQRGAGVTAITMLDTFYTWQRQHKLRWSSAINAGIACVLSLLIIELCSIMLFGEPLKGSVVLTPIITVLSMGIGFFHGLNIEHNREAAS